MKKKKNIFKNIILFNLLIILTFYFVFRNQNVEEIFSLFKTVKIRYVIIAVFAMCIYVICEAINIRRTLNTLGEKTSFISDIKYALIGFFFSSITPAASGGQPMQIYYMHKEGIKVENSTLTLLINLTSMQIVTISLALFSLIFSHQVLTGGLGVFFAIGITLNASALVLLVLAIFPKNVVGKMIEIAEKVMTKLKIKNMEEKKEKIQKTLSKYQENSGYIKKNKKLIIKTILTTYIEFLALYSVSYWVYRSFELNEQNIFMIITLQSILYATVSGIPSPGAVGVTEGGYMLIFKRIYNDVLVNSAMLLNRVINFYLLVVVSGIVVIINAFKNTKIEKMENLEEVEKKD